MAGSKSTSSPSAVGLSGLLVVDKPKGLTSHDVVARVRRIAATKRVGHSGTLDPMATGVLVLCLGKATRLIPYMEEMGGVDAKEYEAEIRFGFETITDDLEGERRGDARPTGGLDGGIIAARLSTFVGEMNQVPPSFSAKKIAGERSYARARRGESVDLAPATIHVSAADLLGFEGDVARVRFKCSRGTYIRSLARDLGRSLEVGGHLVGLRRTRSGGATLDQAVLLEDLSAASLAARLVPMMSILEAWPSVVAGEHEAADLRLGRAVSLERVAETAGAKVRVCDRNGLLIALARSDGSRMQPFCVF